MNNESWEDLWQGLQPGQLFDQGKSAPILATLPISSSLPSEEKLTALIPGCGRGYDVHVLASHLRFSHVVGLEVSETAVGAARTYLSGKNNLSPSSYSVVLGDFFDTSKDMPAAGPFDVAFDYTFFCAIEPKQRTPWAEAYAARLRIGGVLATLMFPVKKPVDTGGPPFGVAPAVYEKALKAAGFQCVEGPRELTEGEAAEGRGGGNSMWALWKRVR